MMVRVTEWDVRVGEAVYVSWVMRYFSLFTSLYTIITRLFRCGGGVNG